MLRVLVSIGKHCRNRNSAPEVHSMRTLWRGLALACLNAFGRQGCPSMMNWRESPGYGKASTEARTRLRWRRSLSGQTRRTGEKMGTKRSLLVDARGVPLSAVVSGANTHDSRLLGATLDQTRRKSSCKRNNLCLDAGYVGKEDEVIKHGLVPHIRPRSEEQKRGRGKKKARRWVVERVFSWLNQYRKLKTRYEKLDVSHQGLLSLCCGMIVWRQTIVIYG